MGGTAGAKRRFRRRGGTRLPRNAALGFAALAAAAAAAQDVAGSRDPAGLARYPGAWIVEHSERAAGALPYDFITAPVDKIRRDVRFEGERVSGALQRVTYRVPDGARLADVIAFYERMVDAISPGVVFSCRGPDCGRSTVWANDVFGVAELNAPNRNQFYLAAPVTVAGAERLIAVYIVQRGNRRIYAHVDSVTPDTPPSFARVETVADALSRDGYVTLAGVEPDAAGTLDADDLAALGEAAAALAEAQWVGLQLVCHLFGDRSVEALLAAAEECAAAAAATLAEGGVTAIPHGIGPLAPQGGAKARVDLVLPDKLHGDG